MGNGPQKDHKTVHFLEIFHNSFSVADVRELDDGVPTGRGVCSSSSPRARQWSTHTAEGITYLNTIQPKVSGPLTFGVDCQLDINNL